MSRLTVVLASRKLCESGQGICCFNSFQIPVKRKERSRSKRHCIRSETENLHKLLERKVDLAVRGERLAQHKLYEAEAEVEARGWGKRSCDIARPEINQEFESQRFQLYQASPWADQADSSSGASHEPSPLTVPSPRGVPSLDSGLPHDTRNVLGTSGNVSESPAREGPPSALFENSKNLASSRGSRPDITGNTTVPEREIRREPRNSSILVPRFQSGVWNSTSYWWNLFSQWYDGLPEISHTGNASWKIPRLHGLSKMESQLQDWSMLKNSRSSSHSALDQRSWDCERTFGIAIDCGANRFPRLRYAWCDDCVCIEKAPQHADTLPKKSECRRAMCSEKRPILTREADCWHDVRAFSCNWSSWSSTRPIRFVQHMSTKWRRPRFRCTMGPSSIISKWNTSQKWFWKDYTSQNCRILFSFTQTVLALYDQESVRSNGQPSYSKTSVRLFIDQTTRTRNFRVRNETVERGTVTKSQKGKKAYVGTRVGECHQWKAKEQCSKGDSCSFRHYPASGIGCEAYKAKGQSSSPAPNSKAKTDGEIPSTSSGNRGESPSDKRSRIPCRYRKSNKPSCNYWHPPVCQEWKSETGCISGNKSYFRHVLSEWNALRCDPERIAQVKIWKLCSTSDCDGIVRSRNCSKQWNAELFTIEDICKTSYWSNEENSKLHGSERSCGQRISHQESKRKESLRWEESVRVFSVEGTRTMFQWRLMQFQSWHNSFLQQWRWSETKRTIVFSRIQYKGKDWRWGTKTLKGIRQLRGKLFR